MQILDGVNLAFHEGGHMIFGILGIGFLTVLGGTLMQLALPAAAAVHFLKRSHKFSGALMILWFGQNFLGIGKYMKDGIDQQLPLIGDGTHDWTYLFGSLGVLSYCKSIGGFTIFLGYLIMAASLGWMSMMGYQKWVLKQDGGKA